MPPWSPSLPLDFDELSVRKGLRLKALDLLYIDHAFFFFKIEPRSTNLGSKFSKKKELIFVFCFCYGFLWELLIFGMVWLVCRIFFCRRSMSSLSSHHKYKHLLININIYTIDLYTYYTLYKYYTILYIQTLTVFIQTHIIIHINIIQILIL